MDQLTVPKLLNKIICENDSNKKNDSIENLYNILKEYIVNCSFCDKSDISVRMCKCDKCEKYQCTDHTSYQCYYCDKNLCYYCQQICNTCELTLCDMDSCDCYGHGHADYYHDCNLITCASCDKQNCKRCTNNMYNCNKKKCNRCNLDVCFGILVKCYGCANLICEECYDESNNCSDCIDKCYYCTNQLLRNKTFKCNNCDNICCMDCINKCDKCITYNCNKCTHFCNDTCDDLCIDEMCLKCHSETDLIY